MIVTVVDRAAMACEWGQPGPFRVILRRVEIDRLCPRCYKPRGEPHLRSFVEDGDYYTASVWTNPCGHVDLYSDVLKEGREPRPPAHRCSCCGEECPDGRDCCSDDFPEPGDIREAL
jgi:hypothetical protein